MHVFSSQVKDKLKRNFERKHPDVLLYIEDPYIERLLDGIFDVVAEEISEIRNDFLKKGRT
ncbi:hypothetical protein ACOQFO_09030 [Ureibacillus sp. MALMAid1270]|uniref:hypothetical protein n=1 Tax=Ureibacillus sp. MALMAid1270 TaxID=3411629 RepID=UPI003BA46E34